MKLKLLAALLMGSSALASATEGYYRYPALHQDQVVFTAEGDLWLANTSESTARRLTTHPAVESEAAISKDGKFVAFLANYEGSNEVYVIPIEGGLAKRVTFEHARVQVQGWTEDGKILFSSNGRRGLANSWSLLTVDPKSLETKVLPLTDAINGDVSSNGRDVYFSQFGLQYTTDNAKMYRGGGAGELWHFKLNKRSSKNKEASLLTARHQGSVRSPMVADNAVYFISDQSGADNIWAMNKDGSDIRQITDYDDWPVHNASLSGEQIVYRRGADLHLLNINTAQSRKLEIRLTTDLPHLREKWINKPLKYLESSSIGQDNSAVITARGRIAIAKSDHSRLVEIDTPKDSRSRNAILSDDGEWVYALNDTSGEMEIWRYAADGSNNAKQLTKDGNIYRWNLYLSPDGQHIAHDDKNGNLWLLDLKSGKNKKVASGFNGIFPLSEVRWSKDSQLIAYAGTKRDKNRPQINLYSVADKSSQTLTTDKYESFSPTFSEDGQWLYFLSNRDFVATPSSPWGDRNMGTHFDRRTQIYAYALTEHARFPFQPENELLVTNKSKKAKAAEQGNEYELKGIKQRLHFTQLPSGNYTNLQAKKGGLYFMDRDTRPGSKPSLKYVKTEPRAKVSTYASQVTQFQLSTDGKQLLLQKNNRDKSQFFLVKAGEKFPKKANDFKLNTHQWRLNLDPKQEFNQLFHDAWLMHRDTLWDKNMRGLDWQEAKKRYQPLLDRITDRHELNDVFKQMMGELNTLHSQVRGGDVARDPNRPLAASLGAEFEQSRKGVRISKIFQHESELPQRAAPLSQPGVNVKTGDVIKRINGKTIANIGDVHQALLNQANKQVLLTVKRGRETIETVVKPTSTRNAAMLHYRDWISQNRTKVEQANPGYGYMHIYAMVGRDIAEFAREFYSNIDKQGLIIDVRRNRGGNIDSWIIEKLMRRAWMFWQNAHGVTGDTNMQSAYRGKLVVLADQFTYSDGETFTAGVKALNLAPVIGKQTAGAGVWLTGRNRLVDGGMARAAEFTQHAMDGRWVVEGHGVKPTIEVDNLPHATFKGHDAQLQAAIEWLNKALTDEPVPVLKAEPQPDKDTPAEDILK